MVYDGLINALTWCRAQPGDTLFLTSKWSQLALIAPRSGVSTVSRLLARPGDAGWARGV